jgi:phosphatidate cytidylyltransferase
MTPVISRVAVVVAGLPVVIASAVVGGWFLFAVVAVGGLVALHELYRLARALRPLVLAGYGGALGAFLGAEIGGAEWMLAGFLVTFPLTFFFAAVSATRQSTTVAAATTVLGAAWVGLGLAHFVLLRRLEADSADAILAVLFTVFATDTAAYVAGRLVGRHKLTPVISPGKTWEGLAAGTAAGLAVAFLVLYETRYSGWRSIVLGAALVAAATVGDLFVSLVKRDLGVKDSGRILLAHGGMLDRVDALLFAGPVGYYTLLAVGHG